MGKKKKKVACFSSITIGLDFLGDITVQLLMLFKY